MEKRFIENSAGMKDQEAASSIHPIFDRLIDRTIRERRLGQRARVFWFTGLSGSGKSTLAIGVEQRLFALGFTTYILDGDNLRTGLNANLGFSEEERAENIRRIAEVAALFSRAGIITLCCFISPTEAIRARARAIIGGDDFIEIYVNTPLEVCESRDVKGLYAKARRGEIPDFTGVSAPFEAPLDPALCIDTQNMSIEEAVDQVLECILPKIRYHRD